MASERAHTAQCTIVKEPEKNATFSLHFGSICMDDKANFDGECSKGR